MDDSISRQQAIDAINHICPVDTEYDCTLLDRVDVRCVLSDLPSSQPERLTDDDFEIIRIHLNAYKEKLCNQRRWKEAEVYQRIIDRFMAFASAQPKRKKGEWIPHKSIFGGLDEKVYTCNQCGYNIGFHTENFCPNCGFDMRGDQDDQR